MDLKRRSAPGVLEKRGGPIPYGAASALRALTDPVACPQRPSQTPKTMGQVAKAGWL